MKYIPFKRGLAVVGGLSALALLAPILAEAVPRPDGQPSEYVYGAIVVLCIWLAYLLGRKRK